MRMIMIIVMIVIMVVIITLIVIMIMIMVMIMIGIYGPAAVTHEYAQEIYDRIVTLADCDSNDYDSDIGSNALSCLRSKTMDELLHIEDIISNGRLGRTWSPVIDSMRLFDFPLTSIANGEYNSHVPILLGSTRDEFATFLLPYNGKVTTDTNDGDNDSTRAAAAAGGEGGGGGLGFATDIIDPQLNATGFDHHWMSTKLNSDDFERLKQIYIGPNSSYEYPTNRGQYSRYYWAALRAETDTIPGLGHCANRFLATLFNNYHTPNVFLYNFSHRTRSRFFTNSIPGTGPNSPFVPHGADMPFVFSMTMALPSNEKQLAKDMASYWISFAATGDPNSGSNTHDGNVVRPYWPSYTPEDDEIMMFASKDANNDGDRDSDTNDNTNGFEIYTRRLFRHEACDFWDEQASIGTA